MKKYWVYEKLDENYKPLLLPINDNDGSITGKIIINLQSYFDENPELRKSLGWVKHIKIQLEKNDYDSQTQRVIFSSKRIDEFTIEDECHFIDKTEEQMLYEELQIGSGIMCSGIMFGGLL